MPRATKVPDTNFTLVDLPKSRTAKHKQVHFTCDSGASISVTNRLDLLENVTYQPGKRVRVANGEFVDIHAIGSIRLHLKDKRGRPYTILQSNVCYAPEFSSNLLSVRDVYKQHKIKTVFADRSYLQTTDGTKLPITETASKQYILTANSVVDVDPLLWHKRFMHASNGSLRNMAKHIKALGGKYDFSKCDACLAGGAKRQHFGPVIRRARPDSSFRKHKVYKYFGQRISSDLCGPFPKSIDGDLYAIIFHDAYSKHFAVYTIPDKSADTILSAFQRFLVDYQDQLPNGVSEFHSDNGSEYVNRDMEEFCKELSIRPSFSVPYAPQQNAHAERAWGTLLRKVRICLYDSKLDDKFWSYALIHAAHINNIMCDENGESPYELVFGSVYSYSELHVWGCLCYYMVPDRDRTNKLSARSLPAVYLGRDPHRHGHVVYVPALQRLTSGYHVVFNEDKYFDWVHGFRGKTYFHDSEIPSYEPVGKSKRQYYTEDRDHVDSRLHPADDPLHGPPDAWNEYHCENTDCTYPRGHDGPCSHEETFGQRFRPRPFNKSLYAQCVDSGCTFCFDHCGECRDDDGKLLSTPCNSSKSEVEPEFFGERVLIVLDDVHYEVLVADLSTGDVLCPDQYKDAISGPLRERWIESMRTEITDLLKHETWELVSRSDKRARNCKPTKSRWVYTIKYNRDGSIERLKSRFVVCGYSQRPGIDYDRAFSATLRATTFRTLLAVAAGRRLRLEHFDVTNAFTQAMLDDVQLLVEPPKGFEEWEVVNGVKVSKLLLLKKALYGTVQASRLWQDTLRAFLVDEFRFEGCGFRNSKHDPCLYYFEHGVSVLIVAVYVDDIIVAFSGDELFSAFKTSFLSRFRAKHIGKLSWYLGLAIDQSDDDFSVTVSNQPYIEKLCLKHIPNNSVSRVHLDPDLWNKLDRAQDDVERAKVASFNYMSVVGGLLYATITRPDIAFACSILAKFMADPSLDCCKAATQLLQYLASNKDRKLRFSGKITVPTGLEKYASDIERNHGFVAWSDSSWGNKYPYPMFGFSVYLFGGLVSFVSKQLKTVAFSSCEAEYAAASYCCKEIEFVRFICADMGVVLYGRLILGVDNTAVIDISRDLSVSGRTKHFSQAIHYIRDLTQLRRVLPVHVITSLQRADGYTKALDKSKFMRWLSLVYG